MALGPASVVLRDILIRRLGPFDDEVPTDILSASNLTLGISLLEIQPIYDSSLANSLLFFTTISPSNQIKFFTKKTIKPILQGVDFYYATDP